MVIVVEGKNDKNKLQSIFKNIDIVITNGSEISNDTIKTIKELSKTNKIVLCLDPDFPGEKIRKKIIEEIPECLNVYAEKQKAISKNKKKVGIEHMSKEDILELFEHIYEPKMDGTITFNELYSLGLMNNKIKRTELCRKLNIGYCNSKQLLKRLNMLGFKIDEIRSIV